MMEKITIKPKSELTKSDVIWGMYANADDTSTLHHCLYNREIKDKYTLESVVINSALCNKKHSVMDENYCRVPIEALDIASRLYRNVACSHCLKAYDKLPD